MIEKNLSTIEIEYKRILSSPRLTDSSKLFHMKLLLADVNSVIRELHKEPNAEQFTRARNIKVKINNSLKMLNN